MDLGREIHEDADEDWEDVPDDWNDEEVLVQREDQAILRIASSPSSAIGSGTGTILLSTIHSYDTSIDLVFSLPLGTTRTSEVSKEHDGMSSLILGGSIAELVLILH